MAKRFSLAASLLLFHPPRHQVFCHDNIDSLKYHKPISIKTHRQKTDVNQPMLGFGFRVGVVTLAPFRVAYLTSLSVVLLASSPVYFVSAKTYENLVHWTLSHSGPTITKLAQWVSARRDLPVPEIVRTAVDRVVDQARMHSDRYSIDLIRKHFGEENFELLECVGSGAIGQVYRALWNETPVAIKVRHPWVETLIYVDLALLEWAAAVLNWFPGMHWLSLPEEVALFRRMMQEQLDFRIEARNLETFRHNFAQNSSVIFPKPIFPFVAEDVLVEEWMPGCPVWKLTQEGSDPLRKRVAAIGLDAFLHMMLVDNFIHADLHPGNILVQLYNPATNEAVEPKVNENSPLGFEPRLVFLDVGLTTSLSSRDLVNLTDLLTAILANNGALAAELMVTRAPASSSKTEVIDPEGFQNGLSLLLKDTFKQSFHLHSFYVSQTLSRLFSLIRKHHVKLDPAFTNLLVSLMVIEGLGRQLDSEIDVLESARIVLRKKEKGLILNDDNRGVILKVMGVLEVRAWWRSEWTKEWEIIDTLLTSV